MHAAMCVKIRPTASVVMAERKYRRSFRNVSIVAVREFEQIVAGGALHLAKTVKGTVATMQRVGADIKPGESGEGKEEGERGGKEESDDGSGERNKRNELKCARDERSVNENV